jgi:hypothetical protein
VAGRTDGSFTISACSNPCLIAGPRDLWRQSRRTTIYWKFHPKELVALEALHGGVHIQIIREGAALVLTNRTIRTNAHG